MAKSLADRLHCAVQDVVHDHTKGTVIRKISFSGCRSI